MSANGDQIIELWVSIGGGEFTWEYEVGSSKQSWTCPLTVDNLAAFTDLLRHCTKVSRDGIDNRIAEKLGDKDD